MSLESILAEFQRIERQMANDVPECRAIQQQRILPTLHASDFQTRVILANAEQAEANYDRTHKTQRRD